MIRQNPNSSRLGVLYNEEAKTDDGKKERAKRLFQTTLNLDRSFKMARDALIELRGKEAKGLSDWVGWWFNSDASSLKRVIGFSLIGLIIVFLWKIISIVFLVSKPVVPQDIYIALGVVIALLLLPSISSLKVGPVELNMRSVGKKITGENL